MIDLATCFRPPSPGLAPVAKPVFVSAGGLLGQAQWLAPHIVERRETSSTLDGPCSRVVQRLSTSSPPELQVSLRPACLGAPEWARVHNRTLAADERKRMTRKLDDLVRSQQLVLLCPDVEGLVEVLLLAVTVAGNAPKVPEPPDDPGWEHNDMVVTLYAGQSRSHWGF
ncbi:MAG: hypothetical protein JW940_02670 [Polyangiaceae bacterium]|nr:hypothetical protein [Polyangiaceae bacterium]